MCIDSQAVNRITLKYCFSIPQFKDLLDQLHGSSMFSKIDLQSGYNQIWMRHKNEWKIVFKTRDGFYEWIVMPFCLINMTSTLLRLMNALLMPFLGRFAVVYLDDILVYSKNRVDCMVHLQKVFETLNTQKLYGKKEKCLFFVERVDFFLNRFNNFSPRMKIILSKNSPSHQRRR